MTIRLSSICFIALLHVCSMGKIDSFLRVPVINGLDRIAQGKIPEPESIQPRRTLEQVSPAISQSQATDKASTQAVEQYNLIWSRGAWKKAIVSLTTLLACHIASHRVSDGLWFVNNMGQFQLPVIFSNFLVPLMASSCCALQLALNVFSFGCAGFNTILGPWRPFFLGLLVYLSFLSAGTILTPLWIWRFVLRWSLALLPEIIHGRKTTAAFLKKLTDRSNTIGEGVEAIISISVPKMGCVACINKIDNSLRKLQGVYQVSSNLNTAGSKGGSTEVRLTARSESDVEMIKNSLTKTVESAGFSQSVILSTEMRRSN